MMLSAIRNKPKKKWIAPILTLGAVLFWIGIWWLAAEQIDKAWVLPTPAQVFKALFSTITLKKVLPTVFAALWGSF